MKLASINLFVLLLCVCQLSNAQERSVLHFQKMHTFNYKSIRLPKNVSIRYFRDFKRQKIKGKLMRYEPPYLYIKTKKDTGEFILHRNELVSLSYINHYGAALAPLIIINSIWAVGFTSVAFTDPEESQVVIPLILGFISGYLVYLEIHQWTPSLDVRHKWSLQKEMPLTRKEQIQHYKGLSKKTD